jgi:hypothetical protein
MFLAELFQQEPLHIEERLRSSIEGVLIPLVAQGVPYTTVDAIIDDLSGTTNRGMGLRIDRALVMQILDPESTAIVKKIEGDRVYLTLPTPDIEAKTEIDAEKDEAKIKQTATAQAQKNLDKPI